MKIRYTFADRKIREVDVTNELGAILLDLDRREYNNDQTETRRHVSLYSMEYEGECFADETDLLESVLRSETSVFIREAVAKLKPLQRELIKALYLSDKPLSHAEYAMRLGISETSVKQNAWRARARLREIIELMKKF